MTMRDEVEATLAALDLGPKDAAAAALALELAAAIDVLEGAERARLLGQLAPGLLRVLTALGATPEARGEKPAAVTTGGGLAALRSA